jgi:hypothetical protein
MSSKSITWRDVLANSEQLSVADQLRLLAELALRLRPRLDAVDEPVDLLTLAGVGQEVWAKVDTENYLNEERDSWQN